MWDIRSASGGLADRSVDLAVGDDVFLDMPFPVARPCFHEIVRVLAPAGEAVFNVFTEDCFPDETVTAWLESEHRYPCLIPAGWVREFFTSRGLALVGEYTAPHGPGVSKYFVFRH